MRPRLRCRVAAHVLDACEVRRRRGRIIEKPQRDPARHEMALDPGVFLGRLGSIRHQQIRGSGIAKIEQFARHDPPLDPPFLPILEPGKLARYGQQHLRGFGDLVVVAQKVHLREEISGFEACVRWHGLQELLGIAGLAVERNARLRDRMPEIGPSGLMSGDGKRGVAE